MLLMKTKPEYENYSRITFLCIWYSFKIMYMHKIDERSYFLVFKRYSPMCKDTAYCVCNTDIQICQESASLREGLVSMLQISTIYIEAGWLEA